MRLVGLVVLFACGARQNQPDPAYAKLEAKLPAALEALGRLRDSIRAAGDDCPQVARSLRMFAQAHHQELRELGELMATLDEHQREKFEYDHHDDRVALAELFALTGTSCRGNKDVDAAVELAGFRSRLFVD
jgi:hypothetical protein